MNYKGTALHIGAAPAEDQIYCYSTSDKAQEKACIGHLRGDFGADGEGFFTSWFPHTGKIMAEDERICNFGETSRASLFFMEFEH